MNIIPVLRERLVNKWYFQVKGPDHITIKSQGQYISILALNIIKRQFIKYYCIYPDIFDLIYQSLCQVEHNDIRNWHLVITCSDYGLKHFNIGSAPINSYNIFCKTEDELIEAIMNYISQSICISSITAVYVYPMIELLKMNGVKDRLGRSIFEYCNHTKTILGTTKTQW